MKKISSWKLGTGHNFIYYGKDTFYSLNKQSFAASHSLTPKGYMQNESQPLSS